MSALKDLDWWLAAKVGLPWLRLTRERAIHERFRYGLSLMDELNLQRPNFLDVGCGSGLMLYYLENIRDNVSEYTGIDIHAARLVERYARMKVPHRFHNMDLDDDWTMPPCDIAWASEVLEHIMDDHGVFRRIAASVRPGGYVVLTMPSLLYLQRVAKRHPDALNTSETQDGGHVRSGYTPEMMRALADTGGLTLESIDAISPRTDFEFANRFLGIKGLWQVIDRFNLSGRPAFVRGAGPEDLEWCYSIAAVMRKPE